MVLLQKQSIWDPMIERQHDRCLRYSLKRAPIVRHLRQYPMHGRAIHRHSRPTRHSFWRRHCRYLCNKNKYTITKLNKMQRKSK